LLIVLKAGGLRYAVCFWGVVYFNWHLCWNQDLPKITGSGKRKARKDSQIFNFAGDIREVGGTSGF
jgi:hypothetical protein